MGTDFSGRFLHRNTELNGNTILYVPCIVLHAIPALLETFWRISLYVTDDTMMVYKCDEKFSQIEGNGRKLRHIQLRNSVIG